MANIKYKDNIDEWITSLRRAGIAIQEAGARTVNRAAWAIYGEYRRNLLAGTLMRNRDFTLKSIKVFEAHAMRSGGKELRKMEDINARVGVMSFSDGREHYLALLEFGNTRKGNSKLENRVPIPLDTSRQGGNRGSPVAAPNRMGAQFQPNSRIDLSRFEGDPRRQYAIMNTMARTGILYNGRGARAIAKAGFFDVDYGDKRYLFRIKGKKAGILRDLSFQQTVQKAEPHMGDAVKKMTQSMMDRMFVEEAERLING